MKRSRTLDTDEFLEELPGAAKRARSEWHQLTVLLRPESSGSYRTKGRLQSASGALALGELCGPLEWRWHMNPNYGSPLVPNFKRQPRSTVALRCDATGDETRLQYVYHDIAREMQRYGLACAVADPATYLQEPGGYVSSSTVRDRRRASRAAQAIEDEHQRQVAMVETFAQTYGFELQDLAPERLLLKWEASSDVPEEPPAAAARPYSYHGYALTYNLSVHVWLNVELFRELLRAEKPVPARGAIVEYLIPEALVPREEPKLNEWDHSIPIISRAESTFVGSRLTSIRSIGGGGAASFTATATTTSTAATKSETATDTAASSCDTTPAATTTSDETTSSSSSSSSSSSVEPTTTATMAATPSLVGASMSSGSSNTNTWLPLAQPKSLIGKQLYDYQLRALSWMRHVERTAAKGYVFRPQLGHVPKLTDMGMEARDLTDRLRSRGGILADQMGLGMFNSKTKSLVYEQYHHRRTNKDISSS